VSRHRARTRPSPLARVRGILLTLGAVIGGLCLVIAVAGALFGARTLVVRSGSMSPGMPTGSLALAWPVDADEIEIGDIVSVIDADGSRITHRVVGIQPASGDDVTLTLQGDANPTPDAQVYEVDKADRVLGSVPWAGRVVVFLGTPGGLLVLGALTAGLLGYAFRPTRTPRGGGRGPGGPPQAPQDDDQPDDRVSATRARGARMLGAAPLVAAVVVSLGATGTAAAFTETAALTTGTITAYTVPATTLTCGGLGLLSVTFNWTAVANATNYTLHYGSGGASTVTVTGTSHTFNSALTGGTAWVVVNRAVGSTTWSSVNSNTRSYTVAVVSLCS
jgi:signal peptidase I